MKNANPLGKNELDLLQFVSLNAPITVGEVAKEYGVPRSLARTTILTVMDRLLAKGYLTRRQVEGVYQYSPKIDHADLLANLVADFVQGALGGSLSPFVAYLSDTRRLSKQELDELKEMVNALEASDE